MKNQPYDTFHQSLTQIDSSKIEVDEDFLNQMKSSFQGLFQLGQQANQIYRPQVEAIIQNKIANPNEIELLLDYMLGFCFDSDILLLYKKLCRYYFRINPHATAEYIYAYRDMWDEDYQSE